MRAFGAQGQGATAPKRMAAALRRAMRKFLFPEIEWRMLPEGDDQVRASLGRLRHNDWESNPRLIWRSTSAVSRNLEIMLSFEVPDGPPLRFRLSIISANFLAKSISDFLAAHQGRTKAHSAISRDTPSVSPSSGKQEAE